MTLQTPVLPSSSPGLYVISIHGAFVRRVKRNSTAIVVQTLANGAWTDQFETDEMSNDYASTETIAIAAALQRQQQAKSKGLLEVSSPVTIPEPDPATPPNPAPNPSKRYPYQHESDAKELQDTIRSTKLALRNYLYG